MIFLKIIPACGFQILQRLGYTDHSKKSEYWCMRNENGHMTNNRLLKLVHCYQVAWQNPKIVLIVVVVGGSCILFEYLGLLCWQPFLIYISLYLSKTKNCSCTWISLVDWKRQEHQVHEQYVQVISPKLMLIQMDDMSQLGSLDVKLVCTKKTLGLAVTSIANHRFQLI